MRRLRIRDGAIPAFGRWAQQSWWKRRHHPHHAGGVPPIGRSGLDLGARRNAAPRSEGAFRKSRHGFVTWIQHGIDPKHLTFAPSKSPEVTWALRRSYPTFSTRSRRTVASRRMAPTTGASATMRSPIVAPMPSSCPAGTPSRAEPSPLLRSPKRAPARIQAPRPRPVATTETRPPKKPCRNEAPLHEPAGTAPHGAGLQPTGRGGPHPQRRHERLTALGIPIPATPG